MKKLLLLCIVSLICFKGFGQGVTDDNNDYLASGNWDNPTLWNLSKNSGVSASKNDFSGLNNDGIAISYTFPVQTDWFDMNISLPDTFSEANSISFFIKSTASSNNLELKFTDTDGSTFMGKVSLNKYSEWEHMVVYLGDMDYVWGGDQTFGTFSLFSIAASGIGSGTIWIDEVGIGKKDLRSTFPSIYDPDSTLAGIGFAQRRDSSMHPEDPLVLKYMKVIQDNSSSAQDLMPSQEDDYAQTFNNAMSALAFIVEGEEERAQRILDFYANATDTSNTKTYKQNFYCNGQAMGFFQNASINTRNGSGDRWIGDMAWLLIACKNYENKFNSHRYDNLVNIIRDLFILYYRDYPSYGYVATGWRNNDTSFDTTGHHEGNIDCYVVFKLLGDNYRAQKIKNWVEDQLDGMTNLPIDLYTWRTLAFGKNYINLLNIPEYNYNYRKIIEINGEDVMGFYSSSSTVDNFWNDGTGHMSCAFQAFGDSLRGYFYANQMDHLIVTRIFDNDTTHAIPYTPNTNGDYSWVNVNKGYSSSTAWYLLAKNGCNPYLSNDFTDTVFNDTIRYPERYYPSQLSISSNTTLPEFQMFPNPFTTSVTINYNVEPDNFVSIDVFDLNGRKVLNLVEKNTIPGSNSVIWDGECSGHSSLKTGVYLIRLVSMEHYITKRIVYQNTSQK